MKRENAFMRWRLYEALQGKWILLRKVFRVCKNRGRLMVWMEDGGRGGAVKVKAKEKRRVHCCFMVLQENLCVIVRTSTLWCSLICYECRVRGSPYNRPQVWTVKEGRDGVRGGCVTVIEWVKREWWLLQKFLKRGVTEGEKGHRGWACGWNQNTQTTCALQSSITYQNHIWF